MYLALRPEEVVPVGEIARVYGLSSAYLMKVAQQLGRCGFVSLLRGVRGGVKLAVAPEKLLLGDVLRAMEPSLALVECFDPETNTCVLDPACALKRILGAAQRALLAELDKHTLADAVRRPGALGELVLAPSRLTEKRAR